MSETATHKPGFLTKIAYGIGGAAGGVKNNGFDYVLLLFYSQIMGLPAISVAVALSIALLVDAISDPMVGYWSDNLRSKLGRRHPFMYVALVPVAVAYYFIWNPPAGMETSGLFAWLLSLTILTRLMYTFFEVPSTALAAELSQDYDDRTSLISFRYFFAWIGGLTVQVILFAVLLERSETDPTGIFHLPGWNAYGLVGGCVIFAAILISSAGTHHQIPHFKAPPPRRSLTPFKVIGEIWETVSNPSFRALFIATMFGLIASGISATLNQYINSFFWGFTVDQIGDLSFAVFVSAILALFIAPIAGKTLGKKRAAIIIGLLAFTSAPAPVFARQLGLMPPNGTEALFNTVLLITVIDVALIIAYQILATSMVADIVEESELKTGRRSEGVFFAGISFMRKLSQMAGVFSASLILTAAAIVPGMTVNEVSTESIRALGWGYAVTLLIVWMLMLLAISFYRISREDHERNLQALADRKTAEA
ncbi:MAG: MFS transporter [Pseudomonadota bacterium]